MEKRGVGHDEFIRQRVCRISFSVLSIVIGAAALLPPNDFGRGQRRQECRRSFNSGEKCDSACTHPRLIRPRYFRLQPSTSARRRPWPGSSCL
jgi:hypothetical protein